MQVVRFGGKFETHPRNSIEIQENGLPPGLFNVHMHPMTGAFWVTPFDPFFDIPDTVYGDLSSKSQRILNTFNRRDTGLGVLLAGTKGSGKTLLSKMVSNELIAAGIPVLLINEAYGGSNFADFLASFDQPLGIFFDEFEKHYRKTEQQEQLLTLFDGVQTRKRLYLVTSNSAGKISEFFHNRPGRFYYSYNFPGVDSEFIEGYVNDNLENKEHREALIEYSLIYDEMNFDMLQAVVEEMNATGEPLRTVLEHLNVMPESKSHTWSAEILDPVSSQWKSFYGGRLYDFDPNEPDHFVENTEILRAFWPKEYAELDRKFHWSDIDQSPEKAKAFPEALVNLWVASHKGFFRGVTLNETTMEKFDRKERAFYFHVPAREEQTRDGIKPEVRIRLKQKELKVNSWSSHF